MSIAEQVSRIKGEKSRMAIKLSTMGLVEQTANLETLADAIENMPDNGSVTATVRQGESYTIPRGYHTGSGTVIGLDNPEADASKYMLQSKSVTPTKAQIPVSPDQGYYGLSSVTVGAIPEAYQDVTQVTATKFDVLVGKKIVSSDGTVLIGEMPNRGSVNIDLGTITPQDGERSYTISPGYYGLGSVKVSEGEIITNVTLDSAGGHVSAESKNIIIEQESSKEPQSGYYFEASGYGQLTATGSANVSKDGYLTAGVRESTPITGTSSTDRKFYKVPTGVVNVRGGELTQASGSASATITGANFELTESLSGEPTSGKKYITAKGSGRVSREAVFVSKQAGYIGSSPDESYLDASAISSTEATVYYTIPDSVVDTASGTAEAYNILKDRKAWVNGVEVTGTMQNNGDMGLRTFNPLQQNYWTLDGSAYVAGLMVGITDDLENELASI